LQTVETKKLAHTRKGRTHKGYRAIIQRQFKDRQAAKLHKRKRPKRGESHKEPETSPCISVLASLCISVPLFSFYAYQLSLLLSPNTGKHPLFAALILF
jgi:hypothetical protein